jgi:GMP synthase-like glutamine amidotransferase
MLLILVKEKPDPVNNIRKLVISLRKRHIPFILVDSCDPNIIKRKDIRGIIIAGTNNHRIIPDEIQPELEVELYYMFHFPKLPVLGLCHGCQFLMVYYGGTLLRYNNYWIGSKQIELDLYCDNIFHGEEKIQQLPVHFHDLPVVSPSSSLKEIAWVTFRDNKRRACAFEFVKDRVYGFMFHPEAKKSTRSILYNFYDRISLTTTPS